MVYYIHESLQVPSTQYLIKRSAYITPDTLLRNRIIHRFNVHLTIIVFYVSTRIRPQQHGRLERYYFTG